MNFKCERRGEGVAVIKTRINKSMDNRFKNNPKEIGVKMAGWKEKASMICLQCNVMCLQILSKT